MAGTFLPSLPPSFHLSYAPFARACQCAGVRGQVHYILALPGNHVKQRAACPFLSPCLLFKDNLLVCHMEAVGRGHNAGVRRRLRPMAGTFLPSFPAAKFSFQLCTRARADVQVCAGRCTICSRCPKLPFFCRTPDPKKWWQCVSRTNPLFRICSLLGFALLIWKQPGSTLTCGFLFSSHRCRCRHLVALRPRPHLGRPHLASPPANIGGA